jgi:hypothetical protein
MTKPSRRASNGRETPSRESAPDDVGLAARDHAQRLADRVAARRAGRAHGEPGAVRAQAHRDHAGGGVGHHHRDEVRGDRALAALEEGAALLLEGQEAADAGADDHAEALDVDALRDVGLLGRLRRRRDREVRVAVRAPDVLGGHRALGVELGARADAVGDARLLRQQRVEELLGALADRRDDPAAGDDDLGSSRHADTPSFSRTSSCTRETASPTEAIDFSRPSAIWIS